MNFGGTYRADDGIEAAATKSATRTTRIFRRCVQVVVVTTTTTTTPVVVPHVVTRRRTFNNMIIKIVRNNYYDACVRVVYASFCTLRRAVRRKRQTCSSPQRSRFSVAFPDFRGRERAYLTRRTPLHIYS